MRTSFLVYFLRLATCGLPHGDPAPLAPEASMSIGCRPWLTILTANTQMREDPW